MNQQSFSFRVGNYEGNLLGFQKGIYWPGYGAQFPTGKIRDDVFGAVGHQQAHHVALADTVCFQQLRRLVHYPVEFRKGEPPAIRLAEEEIFLGSRSHSTLQQLAQGFRICLICVLHVLHVRLVVLLVCLGTVQNRER